MFDTDPVWVIQWTVPETMLTDDRVMSAFRAAITRQWYGMVTRDTGTAPRVTPRVTLVRPAFEELTLLDERTGEPVRDEAGEIVTVREPWLLRCEGKAR